MAIQAEGLTINEVLFDMVSADEFYYGKTNGTTLVSWNAADGVSNAQLITLDVTALRVR